MSREAARDGSSASANASRLKPHARCELSRHVTLAQRPWLRRARTPWHVARRSGMAWHVAFGDICLDIGRYTWLCVACCVLIFLDMCGIACGALICHVVGRHLFDLPKDVSAELTDLVRPPTPNPQPSACMPRCCGSDRPTPVEAVMRTQRAHGRRCACTAPPVAHCCRCHRCTGGCARRASAAVSRTRILPNCFGRKRAAMMQVCAIHRQRPHRCNAGSAVLLQDSPARLPFSLPRTVRCLCVCVCVCRRRLSV